MKRCSIHSLAVVMVAAAVCMPVALSAAPVTANQAKIAASNWLGGDSALGCRLQGEVAAVRTCTPTNGASFHVVKMAEGGFVVMSADTTRAPVVAFSSGADLVEDDANPLWVLLKRDLAIRTQGESSGGGARLMGAAPAEVEAANEAKWAKLLGGGAQLMSMQGISSVSDVRVEPLVQSKWNQDNVGGNYCYNYYTPNHYVCGCVATAGAQIMRYFCYPTAAMSPYTNEYCAVNGTPTTLITQGGTYDWGQMPLVPDSSMTDAQRQAIGKLTSDVGICCNMNYKSGGSSSGGYMLAHVFTNHFGYASAQVANWNTDQSGSANVKNALLSNFDAGLPVALGLDSDYDGGHEIVGDGYGYSDGTLYIHFNMGWGGYDDAWYAPPAMENTQYNFSIVDGVVYNVFTNLPLNTVICSGRVLDASGIPVENAMVTAKISGTSTIVQSVTSNAKGIYALTLPAAAYTITATSCGTSASVGVTLSENVSIEYAPGGSYWSSPKPQVNNVCEKDIVLTGVASVAEPQFTPPSCLFYPSTNVVISCATAGATIRYTDDGSDPTESSTLYTGAITVSDNVTIKARAWKNGMNPSVIVTATYTYDAAQGAPNGDYFADPIVITGANGSRVIEDNSAYTVEDGEPLHTRRSVGGSSYTYNYQYRTIWYQWTAPGSGTITFRSKCSGGGYRYPTFIAVYTGDTLTLDNRQAFAYEYDTSTYITTLDFEVEQGVTYRIVGMMGYDGSGTFTLTWSGDLTVVSTETSTTEVPVPYTWLDGYFAGQGTSAQAYETLANTDQDGDGFTTWQEYLAGTDPTNATSSLQVSIRMEGMTPVIEWNTTNDNMSALGYQYVPKGKTNLTDAVNWSPTTDGHRFFKLFIEPIQ